MNNILTKVVIEQGVCTSIHSQIFATLEALMQNVLQCEIQLIKKGFTLETCLKSETSGKRYINDDVVFFLHYTTPY